MPFRVHETKSLTVKLHVMGKFVFSNQKCYELKGFRLEDVMSFNVRGNMSKFGHICAEFPSLQ